MSSDARQILRHWREAVPKDRMAHLVRDTERAFRRDLQARLAPHGVPFGHWSFLRILWEADGLTQRELSARAGVMEPTTFAALKAMEAQGWIARSQRPDNRKNVYVHLTEAGRALKDVLVPLAIASNRVSVRGVPAADVETARRVLLAMIANLAEDDAAASPGAATATTCSPATPGTGSRPRARRSAALRQARSGPSAGAP